VEPAPTTGTTTDQIEPSTTNQTAITDRRFTTNYDATGLSVKDTLPGGVIVTRTYDELSRLKTVASNSISGQAAAANVSFNYDRLGRVVSGTHPNGTVAISYNERNQVASVTAPNSGNSSFTYDQAGRTQQRVDTTGTATYSWDAADQLVGETDPLTGQARLYTWRADGQVSGVTYAGAGGVSRAYAYDTYGRLITDSTTGTGGATLRSATYGYDPSSTKLTTETIAPAGTAGAGTNTYSYDLAGRLTSWQFGATTTTYGWDDAGNRTSVGATTSTYDARNRLVSTSAGEIDTWTKWGALASQTIGGTTTNFTFDGLGRMTVDGNVTYTYDAFDRMASRTLSGATSQMLYSGLNSQPSADGSNTIARSAAGEPISLKVGTGAAQVIGQDRHGDVVSFFTPTATALTDSIDYTPFGDPTTHVGTTANRVGFQADWTDPTTKLVNMGARWFSPGWGDFISRDTHNGALKSPVTLNRYTYANDDPLGYTDPDGHYGMMIDGRQIGVPARLPSPAPTIRTAPPKSGTHSSLGGAKANSNNQMRSAIDQAYAYHYKYNEYNDPRKDPMIAKLAHLVVITNTSTFDTAADHVNPDGNIGKRDFEAVRDGGGYPAALSWAAGFLLGNDKDVSSDVRDKVFSSSDLGNIEDYGWKMYSWKHKKSAWETVVSAAKAMAGPVAGLLAFAACGVAVGLASAATAGAAAAGAAGCSVVAGAAQRAVSTLANGGSIMASLSAAADPKSVLIDATIGAAMGAGGHAISSMRGARAVVEEGEALAESESGALACDANSFTGDTLVARADGTLVAISTLRAGDKVIATDPATGLTRAEPIEKVIVHGGRHTMVDVTLSDGSTITATDHHPFWDDTQHRFVYAIDIKAGDNVLRIDGSRVRVARTREYAASVTAFNLSVHKIHTYFVGTAQILVHNSCVRTKTYQTYTKTNPETGQVYSGRTSGFGTPTENVDARDIAHHMTERGFGPAVLDETSSNPWAIRGREQQLIESFGGAQSFGGTSGNAINGISPRNPRLWLYLDAATSAFG
jgi:RHS repeat-associated protein